jgi:hypothetical protein
MPPREMELFVKAIIYAKRYSDSNPDVGFGPSWHELALAVASQLSFTISRVDILIAAYLCKIETGANNGTMATNGDRQWNP